jgi:excisionase family DNA binding protein
VGIDPETDGIIARQIAQDDLSLTHFFSPPSPANPEAFQSRWRRVSVDTVDLSVEYGRIPQACRRYGLSRSRLYRLAAEDLIRFVKVGSATLVDFASVRSYLASCEKAQIRACGQRNTQARQVNRLSAASDQDGGQP